MKRFAVLALVATIALAPLAARADLTITFRGLEANQLQPGCRLVSSDRGAKTTVVSCDPKILPESGGSYSYSETWDVPTSDRIHYGGCGVRARVRSHAATDPVYDAEVTGSQNFTCTLHWQSNSALDVRYAIR